MKLLLLILAAFGCLVQSTAYGRAVGKSGGGFYSQDTPWSFHTWGSFKSIAAYQQMRQTNIFASSDAPFAEQRLRFGGAISKDWFRFEFANEFYVFAHPPNPSILPIPDLTPQRAFDATTSIYSSDSFAVANHLDRAFVQLTFNESEFKIGRQVTPMGVGKVYNAVSQVPRQAFIVVDSEYPFTEDAVAYDYNGPLLFQARFLPRVSGQEGHNFHLRIGERNLEYDLVLTAGRSDDKLFLGLETAHNWEGFVIRGEIAAYDHQQASVIQSLIGIDRVFSEEFSAVLEFFYNGFGTSNTAQYDLLSQEHRSSPYKGTLYMGARLSSQITPLLQGSLGSSTNLNDASTLFHLSLNYSVSDNLELLFGQYFSVSPNPLAEYGGTVPLGFGLEAGLPDLSYLLLKYHF